MSMLLIVIIVVAALVLLALLIFGGKRKRQKKVVDRHLERHPRQRGARNATACALNSFESGLVTSIRE